MLRSLRPRQLVSRSVCLRTFRSSRALLASEEAKTTATDLTLNCFVPGQTFYDSEKVLQVDVPGTEGHMGIMANHAPVMTELNAGVVTVTAMDKSINKFFISSGFLFVHPNSVADLALVEALPLDMLSVEKANSELHKAEDRLKAEKEGTPQHAEAQIEVDVGKAMVAALAAK